MARVYPRGRPGGYTRRMTDSWRVGVISDTHGLLRPEVLARLKGVNVVLHAGDVGRADILAELHDVAPTLAVRGNVDRAAGVADLPATLMHEVGGVWLYMLHDLAELDLDPVTAGVRIVISGHSHVPVLREERGVLYLNPGSCGPRRFSLPVSLALLTVEGEDVRAELVTLDV